MPRFTSGLLLIALTLVAAAEPGDRFEQVAVAWGFEPIEQLELAEGDEEIRVWRTGFGIEGYVLSRRGGSWSFYHLSEPGGYGVFLAAHDYHAAELQPVCAASDIAARLAALGLYRLADPLAGPRCQNQSENEPCLDRIRIDGWSAHIRVKSHNLLGQWDYPDPGLPYFADPAVNPLAYPSYAAEQIYRFLHFAVGGHLPQSFEPHSKTFQLPAIVLWRERGRGVVAYRIEAYDTDGAAGVIRYHSLYFSETPQGFVARPRSDQEPVEIRWQGNAPYQLGMRRDERFALIREGDRYRAVLTQRFPHESMESELAVVQNPDLQHLDYVTLTSGFEAKPRADYALETCSRVRKLDPIEPQHNGPPATLSVEAAAHPEAWVVLPEALQKNEMIAVEATHRPRKFWVHGPRLSDTGPVIVRVVSWPAPPGSDKPYWELLRDR